MVHTTLIPKQAIVELALPNHYVGKKVAGLIPGHASPSINL